MGLAASQARFLNLTARKTNIEYEAQQINQQRTTLANQSATTYNQMLTLSVPTPPSEAAFQTIQYNFTYGGDSYSISQVTGKDSKATVLATRTYVDNYVMKEASSSDDYTGDLIEKRADGYYLGSTKLKSLQNADDTDVAAARADIVKGINKKLGTNYNENGSDIYYVNVSSDKTPVYRYYLKSQVEVSRQNEEKAPAIGYVAGSETKYEQTAFSGAELVRDANNRIVSITHNNLGGKALSVTSITVKDTVAYEDAYNEYEYQTYLYQQKMEQINAQTSVIQAQDKKLELRLKQLDTEQNAIKTEMDSVSNVVKKNVEDTFKIFA